LDINKYKKQIIVAVCLIAVIVVAIFVMASKNKSLDVLEVKETTTETTTQITTTVEDSTTATPTTTTAPTTTVTTVTTTETPKVYEATLTKEKISQYSNASANCKGWIYIADSAIDYPLMQSDDNEFYVTHDWKGNTSSSGAIMLDYECTIGQTNNVLMYGHNMGNGSMFHAIKSYKDKDWWKSHQYVEVADLEKVYIYQIFSIDVLYGLWDADFTYWLEPNKSLSTEEDYNYFVNCVLNEQYTSIGVEAPTYPTKMITLQTCNSGTDDGMRCVAFGKLIDVQDLK
jgi:sortase B